MPVLRSRTHYGRGATLLPQTRLQGAAERLARVLDQAIAEIATAESVAEGLLPLASRDLQERDRRAEAPLQEPFTTPGPAASPTRARFPETLPLVGRGGELAAIEALLEAREHSVTAAVLRGSGGVGKSRLASEVAVRAERRGWQVLRGRAYPVESGIPYALLSDAFLPLLRDLDPDTLTVLTRGGHDELRYLFPALGPEASSPLRPASDPEEFRTRLLWNFAEFTRNFAARTPLLVVLEDLHWADESSLQLLHFLARQAVGAPIFLLCTYNDEERDRSVHLAEMERSLVDVQVGAVYRLAPLELDEVTELVCRMFEVNIDLVREFAAVLYGWTRGNLFFLREVLKSLVESGRLVRRKGTWIGWDVRRLGLPGSVREAILARMRSLSLDAQRVADIAAVIGTRASYPLLASVSGLDAHVLISALEELCRQEVLTEQPEDGTVIYRFAHPLVRETLYSEFGLQHTRLLHGAVAEAMEAYWGDGADAHADELAYHFARTDTDELDAKAVRYLAAAGRNALARHADREAVNYLRAARERLTGAGREGGRPAEGGPSGSGRGADAFVFARVGADAPLLRELTLDLARAETRLGEYDAAIDLWSALLAEPDLGRRARAGLEGSIGRAQFWSGRVSEALRHFDAGLSYVERDEAPELWIRLRLARATAFQEIGRGADAVEEVESLLPTAEALGNVGLLARVHRSLAMLHIWTGPTDLAYRHAERAIELARTCGDRGVEFWSRWAMAMMAGLTGKPTRMAEGIAQATALAEDLRSPVLRLWTSEMTVELAYATGDWDTGVALGEQSIALARQLHQRMLLPRLLVWTALFHLGRGALDRARELVDEACGLSEAATDGGEKDIYLVVPAHIGLAACLLAEERFGEAVDVARRGLEIAERTGYVLWAVHRILPILAEALLWAERPDEAERVGKVMRAKAERLDHRLAVAWADACDALVCWKRGDSARGAALMQQAAEALEAIPMVPYAARLRRQLAGRLAEIGEREACLRELRHVHDVFVRLGADKELEKTRIQFREVGARPPPRGTGEGMRGLTSREMEIARLVARRMSNKAVARELGISPRTVGTHLSNIFLKLDMSSRSELADIMRAEGALED